MSNPEKLYSVDLTMRAMRARLEIREVERFAYRIVADAKHPEKIDEAKRILQLAVGLRRKLDLWKEE